MQSFFAASEYSLNKSKIEAKSPKIFGECRSGRPGIRGLDLTQVKSVRAGWPQTASCSGSQIRVTGLESEPRCPQVR
jgi:hypothetical protein